MLAESVVTVMPCCRIDPIAWTIAMRSVPTRALQRVVERGVLVGGEIELRGVVHHAHADVAGEAIGQQRVEEAVVRPRMAPSTASPHSSDEPPEVSPSSPVVEPDLDRVENRLRDPEHGDRQQCAGDAARERGADDAGPDSTRDGARAARCAQGASA